RTAVLTMVIDSGTAMPTPRRATRPCLGSALHPQGHILTEGSRCAECRSVVNRERDQRRGSTTERGYGADDQVDRARVLGGATRCRTCGQPFTRDNPATGGHVKARRHGGKTAGNVAPECRRCNYGWNRGAGAGSD